MKTLHLRHWILVILFAVLSTGSVHAQTDPLGARTDYRNEIYSPAYANTNTSLTQTLSVAFYSGNIGDAPNSANPTNSAKTTTPNDGTYYLLQSIIGQPVGVAPAPFNFVLTGVGTITPSPDMYAATNWYQLGQKVTLIAQPGRYYAFTNWTDGNTNAFRSNITVGPTNYYQVNFTTNGTILETQTNAITGTTRIAPRGTPWVLVNGTNCPNNILRTTNGAPVQITILQPSPSYTGPKYYTLTNSDPSGAGRILYTNTFMATAPFTVRAVAYQTISEDNPAPCDPVSTLIATTPGGGSIADTSQTDFYTGDSVAILTANPAPGWSFMFWTNGASGTANPLTIIVKSALFVQAVFGTTVNPTNQTVGGVVLKDPAGPLYPYGGTVRLSASPTPGSNPGYYFARWNGDPQINLVTNTPVNFVVTSINADIRANFSQLDPGNFSLTHFIVGDGTVSPHAPFYPSNAVVTLFVTNGSGQAFTGWSGDTNGATVSSNSITITMNTNKLVTASFAPSQPVFLLSSNFYFVSESTNLSLTVSNIGAYGGKVTFSTLDGTAIGGTNVFSDYVPTTNTLTFADGEHAKTVQVQIKDQYLVSTNSKAFTVRLSGATNNASSTNFSYATPTNAPVTIVYDDVVSTNGSELTQAFPGPIPTHNASLQVTFTNALPNVAGGFWRFQWELAWRTNQEVASNLFGGEKYPVEFRQIANNFIGDLNLAEFDVANGDITGITNGYISLGQGVVSSLSIHLGPNLQSVQTGGGWKILGETAWRPSDDVATNQAPGELIVEFRSVTNRATPPTSKVFLPPGSNVVASVYYVAAADPGSARLPSALPSLSSITSSVSATPRLPYAFGGQIISDSGDASGTAVLSNVVLTAAHVVFDDYTLTNVQQVYWFFQRETGELDPRPLQPRGWYMLSGYASARVDDLTVHSNIYSPGVSSPASRGWDAAALFFPSAAARGGWSGYLSSDNETNNEWLTVAQPKLLMGYPVDASGYALTNVVAGKMHAVPITNGLTLQSNHVYSTSEFLSFSGNSGGALCVLHSNHIYYPAAIYLGTVGSESVVRGIDSNVVTLITAAAFFGDSGPGTNNSGVIRVLPNQNAVGNLAYLTVILEDAAARTHGAAFSLNGGPFAYTAQTNNDVTTNGQSYNIQFRTIAGWDAPPGTNVTTTLGHLTTVTATYVARPAQLVVTPTGSLAASGFIGGPFTPPSFSCVLSNAGGSNLTWRASSGAAWLTVSPTNATLGPTSNAVVTITINTNANGLPVGVNNGTVMFTNLTTHLGDTVATVTLTTSPLPELRFLGLQLLPDNSLALTLQGAPNRSYAILSATDLLQTNWSAISTVTLSSTQITFTNSAPATNQQQYYRAVYLP